MTTRTFVGLLAAMCLLMSSGESFAKGGRGGGGGGRVGGGGGGGRPSFAGAGGGGARPNFGGGGGGNFSRPPQNFNRPSAPNVNRPSVSNMNRPQTRPSTPTTRPSNPGLGQFHPGGGGTRPATRPSLPSGGTANRPSVRPPGDLKPARPSLPGGGNVATRPSPGIGDRPGIGTLPADRPSFAGGNRPNIPNRPINRPDTLPSRPVIGGGGNGLVNRPGAGWGVNYPNRIDPGQRPWDRPGKWHDHDWGNHWHDHYVNNHFHGWYHGCWHGHWGNNWYSPILWAGAGYGVGSWWNYGYWGYGPSYYNPYYTTGSGYDYSQPIVINQYVADDQAPAALQAQDKPPEENRALTLFDEGAALFKEGRYPQAYAKLDAAQKLMPRDPVIHEVKALTLFALGRYKESAAILNALLASSPGMDWTSMSALYGNDADYTAQLRKLEAAVKANTQDAAAIFVLAYHYLVIGENNSAVNMLRAVVKLQPQDMTARRMLDALAPPETKPADPPPADDAPAGPSTDLVGKWSAQGGDATIELSITEDGKFVWKATPKGKAAVTVSGNVTATEYTLSLESKEQGAMVGKVKSLGPDKFNFLMAGTPSSDPGLDFVRR